ncbi:VOC family protein [Devosia nitrariae]|uniref:VOC domain-containing protein n=1 Tax=Devosia nitrariae TaxID=2071872 RepID=A0ABQ5W6W6_9HYPH|nr:hypothetical protein [Devosia nitrariae]GLQ55680.1 hypothetical protein GCM10010862_29390 [Devosia nitrariae]
MPRDIYGGINIAMKVPTHQYQETVAFYRDTLGLETFTEKHPHIGFIYGPNRLWVDEVGTLSQAEVWLELFTPDFEQAAVELTATGITRNDAIEPLGEGFRGGWFFNPAGIVHLVREPEAW